MATSGIGTFDEVLLDAGRQALLRTLAALCADVGAAESSILRPAGEADLGFFVSTNPALMASTVPTIPIGGSFAGIVFRTGQMLAVADAESQPGHFGGIDTVVGRATREYAALPIPDGARLLGVLTVVNRAMSGQGPRPFTVDELDSACRMAIALAGPIATLDNILSPSREDDVRGAGFVSDLLSLDETGRRVVRSVVAALIPELGADRS
jgi:GAF domain-containing protein